MPFSHAVQFADGVAPDGRAIPWSLFQSTSTSLTCSAHSSPPTTYTNPREGCSCSAERTVGMVFLPQVQSTPQESVVLLPSSTSHLPPSFRTFCASSAVLLAAKFTPSSPDTTLGSSMHPSAPSTDCRGLPTPAERSFFDSTRMLHVRDDAATATRGVGYVIVPKVSQTARCSKRSSRQCPAHTPSPIPTRQRLRPDSMPSSTFAPNRVDLFAGAHLLMHTDDDALTAAFADQAMHAVEGDPLGSWPRRSRLTRAEQGH
jgi:hypothetical protein